MMAPFHIAVQRMHDEVMKVLLEHRSTDVNLEGESGNTAVMIACTKNNSEALQTLLNKGAQPRKSNKFGCFPTHQAVLSGSEECMEIILKFGEEHGYSRQLYINCVNNGKASPLHLAVQNGDLEIVKMCLDNGAQIDLVEGADINSIDSEGRSPLILATASASWNVVNLLLSKGTKRNQAK
ncbi:transient receptor potential cation channel subfamily A member 1-like isoform X2 [Callithrix jacchus]